MKKISYLLITIMLFVASGVINAASDTPFVTKYTTLTNDNNTFVFSSDEEVDYDRLGIPSGNYSLLYTSDNGKYVTRKSQEFVSIDEYKGCYVKLNNNSGFFNLDDIEFYIVYENHTEEIPRQLLNCEDIKRGGYDMKKLSYGDLEYIIKYNAPTTEYSFFNDIQKYYEVGEELNLNNTYAIINGIRISGNEFTISGYNPNSLGIQTIVFNFDNYVYYENICVVEDKTNLSEEFEVNFYTDEPYICSGRDYGNKFTALTPGVLEYKINEKQVKVELSQNEQYFFNENAIFNFKFTTYYGVSYEDYCYNLLSVSTNPVIYSLDSRMKVTDESGNEVTPTDGKYELGVGYYNLIIPSDFLNTFQKRICVIDKTNIDYECLRSYEILDGLYCFDDVDIVGTDMLIKDYSIKVNGVEYEDIDFGNKTLSMNGDYEINVIGIDGTQYNLNFRLQYTINTNAFLILLGIGIVVLVIIPMINNKMNKNRMNKEIQGYGQE